MASKMRLFYAPDNASLCVRLALEELSLPYETTLVDRTAKAQKSADYLALNPNGLIPVLTSPRGPMFETGAILLWLSDRYGGLMPTHDCSQRAHALQWLFWISNTLHPTLGMLFYPDQYTDADAQKLQTSTRKRLALQLSLLNKADNADWLDSDAATAQGCYLGPLLRWCDLYGGGSDWFDLNEWPRLHRFAKRVEVRSAVMKAAKLEGLGSTPFSAPQLPNPPEGSAT